MTAPQDVDTLPPEPADDRTAALPRLLGHLRRVLSHDLANELVAVQGLLQLLQLDEGPRLGADGQEYLGRAATAARRAQATVQTLKELARLGCEAVPRETVRLDELAREVGAELRQLYPACALEWRLGSRAVRASVPRRLLQQGLFRLLATLLAAEGGRVRLGIHSRRTAAGVELAVATAAPVPAPDCLDWILAQELLAACGGTLRARPEPGRGNVFLLTVPPPEDDKMTR
jgi:signal transduction histidine kinase